ncbi:uroporphyrinogen decarboxylase family protein [Acetonema longum]|uniref:Putative uroporphyrinogen-III decarboxylase-like protein n=1 Tax=Acetonema longum DSM 6540 TaxID=1009370 RepID=F7NNZ6_9FIRM|nr:uroporphyrinogen decarboxylase family protein [Acetonema longum]EGO62330.1 putative uroporphyrinogen-III decarboxylase-like protein [Acetonema longum DSM 6540]
MGEVTKDTMTAEARLVAAVNLQPVDRVVCAPIIEQYAGQFAGITNKEYMWDWEKAMAATEKVWQAFPVWDSNAYMLHGRYAPVGQKCGPGRLKMPGRELGDNAQYQIVEFEAMLREDYALVKEKGFMEYRLTFLERVHQVSREEIAAAQKEMARLRQDEIDHTLRRGQSLTWGAIMGVIPFDGFSMMRSMDKFYKDMFQIGDQLEELLWIVNDAVIAGCEAAARLTGSNRVFVGAVRGAGQFISARHFDRFVGPYMKVMVEKLGEKNIVPILHCDADWTKNLEFFLQLPKAKFVLELDGATDIFKAYEILKGHCAIKGDVPAALFTVASPGELDDYAKKLISTFKNGEGLIYSSGCNLPMNARHENVKAFFDAVDKYGRYN